VNVQGTQSAATSQRNGTTQQTAPRNSRTQPTAQRNAANPANQSATTVGAHTSKRPATTQSNVATQRNANTQATQRNANTQATQSASTQGAQTEGRKQRKRKGKQQVSPT